MRLWFRMWSESKNDAKLDALTDHEFRAWFKLLCTASENAGVIDYTDPELVALSLRMDPDDLSACIERMKRLRLVENGGNTIRFPSFEKRQYMAPSDKPEAVRERVARHRQKRRNDPVTTPVTPCNEDVTTCVTSYRTEKNREEERETGALSECNAALMAAFATFPNATQMSKLAILCDRYGPDALKRIQYGIEKAKAGKKPNVAYAIGCAENASAQELTGTASPDDFFEWGEHG